MLAAVMAMWVLFAPQNVQNLVYLGSAAATGTCASADLSEVELASQWKNADCSVSAFTSNYVFDTADGDYPTSTTMTYNGPTNDDVVELSKTNDIGPLSGDDCTLLIDHSTDQDSAAAYGYTVADVLPGTTSKGSIYMEMIRDYNSADPGGTLPVLMSLGGTSTAIAVNSVYFFIPGTGTPDDNLSCTANGSANDQTLSTSTDTTSSCCGGSNCNDIFSTFDDTAFSAECIWDFSGGGPSFKLLINGCEVASDTSTSTTLSMGTTTDFWVGDAGTFNKGKWAIGRWAVGSNSSGSIILSDELSGETGAADLTDGDECFCGNVGSGTDCGG